MIKNLAKRKWFVPMILFLLLVIAASAFTGKREVTLQAEDLSTSRQVEELCNSVRGVSNAKVMITYTALPVDAFGIQEREEAAILGIAVVCDGGGDPNVQLALHELLGTLFQLSSTQITISERN